MRYIGIIIMKGKNGFGEPVIIEKELLEQLLLGNQFTGLEIAKIFNTSNSVISNRKMRYNIGIETVKEIMICEFCGKEFEQYKSNRIRKHIFCSITCDSKFKKTQRRYEIEPELLLSLYWGNQYSSNKISKLLKTDIGTILRRLEEFNIPSRSRSEAGKLLDYSHLYGRITWNNGKTHNEDKRIPCGDKSGGWRGGVSSENMKLRRCWKYEDWRKKVFERDGYCCQLCHDYSRKGHKVYFNAHHIKSWAKFLEERFKVENGITLCRPCHIYVTNIDILSQQ